MNVQGFRVRGQGLRVEGFRTVTGREGQVTGGLNAKASLPDQASVLQNYCLVFHDQDTVHAAVCFCTRQVPAALLDKQVSTPNPTHVGL